MILRTVRTESSPLKRSDFEVLVEMYFEPDSNKYVSPLKDRSASYYREFLEKKLTQNDTDVGFWVIRDSSTQSILGTMNLNYFEALSVRHIGCHLKRDHWGKGYATEVLSNLLDYGLKQKCFKTIHALVEKGNHASKRMLLKIGMIYEKDTQAHGTSLEVYCTQEILSAMD